MVQLERAIGGIQLSIVGLFLLQLFSESILLWVSIILLGVGTLLVLNSMTHNVDSGHSTE